MDKFLLSDKRKVVHHGRRRRIAQDEEPPTTPDTSVRTVDLAKDENEMPRDIFLCWKSDTLSTINSGLSEKQRSVFLCELLGQLPATNRLYLVRSINKIATIDFVSELPVEVALLVVGCLDVRALFTSTQVSKYWKKLITSTPSLWRRQCLKYRITIREPCVPNPDVLVSYYKHTLSSYFSYLSKLKHKTGYRTESVYEATSEYAHSSRTLGITCNTSYIYTGSDDRHIRVWDRATHMMVSECQSMGVSCLDCTEGLVAAGQFDGCITIYDTLLSRVIATCSRHMGPVYTVKCVPDSSLIVSGSSDCTVRIWAVSSQHHTVTCYYVFRGHETMINNLSVLLDAAHGPRIFSMDIACINVLCINKKVQLHSLKPAKSCDNKEDYFLPGLYHSSEITQRYRNVMACGSSNGIYFWDTDTYDLLRIVISHGYVCSENIIGLGSSLMIMTYDDGIAVVDSVSGQHHGTIPIAAFNNASCGIWINEHLRWLDGLMEHTQIEAAFVATTMSADVVTFYLKQ